MGTRPCPWPIHRHRAVTGYHHLVIRHLVCQVRPCLVPCPLGRCCLRRMGTTCQVRRHHLATGPHLPEVISTPVLTPTGIRQECQWVTLEHRCLMECHRPLDIQGQCPGVILRPWVYGDPEVDRASDDPGAAVFGMAAEKGAWHLGEPKLKPKAQANANEVMVKKVRAHQSARR